MSYTPTIIISHSDLHENEGIILEMANHPNASEAMKHIESLLSAKPFSIKGYEFITTQPELSAFSKKVRELLIDFKIDYALID